MTQRILFFLSVVLAAFLISIVSLKHTVGDFDVYYNSSHHYLASAPVYVPHGGIEEFKYSPFFALVFSPLTLMKELPALYVWTVLNILFLFGILIILYKLKQVSFNCPKDLMILICVFALTGRFIVANFKLGQVNIFLCFVMVLIMYFEINKKYFLSAVMLAFSLMIKFFPLLFVVYFLLRRRFKLLAYTLVMIAVFLFLPSLYSGIPRNCQYLHEWFALLKINPPALLYSVKNYSLLAYFSWVFIASHEVKNAFDYIQIKSTLTPQVFYAWGIACFAFFATFFYDTFFVKDKESEVTHFDYSGLFLCGLLFNPLAYLNALVFLIIPYFFILRHLFYTPFNKKHILFCTLLVTFSFVCTILDNRLFFKNADQFSTVLELKPLMWSIILVYISLLIAKFSLKVRS